MVNPKPFWDALIGKRVSHIWRGYGSAIFMEFGNLTDTKKRTGARGEAKGEVSLILEESWRIERPRSILGGAWSPEQSWPAMFKRLIGSEVREINLFGILPEISVSLKNGMRVCSYCLVGGQPSWAIITVSGSLCVKKGQLHVEKSRS